MTRQEIKREISELKKEMKIDGVKITACFNGGLDKLTYQYNMKLFALKVKLDKTP